MVRRSPSPDCPPSGPQDRRPGEGQRLTPDAPRNGGRPHPLGTAPQHPRGTQPSQGMQAKGTVLGPHTDTPAPTAREWGTPAARPVGMTNKGRQQEAAQGTTSMLKKKKHETAFHALSIGETQCGEVCYRRRSGKKKTTREETQNTTPKKKKQKGPAHALSQQGKKT